MKKVHPESELNSNRAHNEFLEHSTQCLPEGSQPIIISDAIFRVPWFKAVEAKAWYWLGRVRGNVMLSDDRENLQHCKRWFSNATRTAKHLSEIFYSKSSAFSCQGYSYRGKAKGRGKQKNEAASHVAPLTNTSSQKRKSLGCW